MKLTFLKDTEQHAQLHGTLLKHINGLYVRDESKSVPQHQNLGKLDHTIKQMQ